MWLLILAIMLLLSSILLSAYYTSCFEKVRVRRLPTIKYGVFLLCVTAMLFIVGTIMLFIATGWKWGLAGLGISWLVFMGVNYSATATYRAHEYVDPLLIKSFKEVSDVEKQHHEELKAIWLRLGSEITAGKCIDPNRVFYQELQKNCKREFREIMNPAIFQRIKEQLQEHIYWSFLAGCMVNNNWITQRLSSDINLIIGDRLVTDIKAVRGRTKCRGTALGIAFAAVSVQGQLFARGEKANPTEGAEILEVNLLTTETLSEVKDGIVPKKTSDIALTTIPPWDRELDAIDEIMRALELIAKRAHMPGIDGKEITLLLLYQTQLTLLLEKEHTLGELIVELKLSLLKGESLGEVSEADIPKEREHIEKQKVKFQTMVEEDKEAVRNILKDLGLT